MWATQIAPSQWSPDRPPIRVAARFLKPYGPTPALEKREEKRRLLDLQKDEQPPVSLQDRSIDEMTLIVRASWLIDRCAPRIACVSKEFAVACARVKIILFG